MPSPASNCMTIPSSPSMMDPFRVVNCSFLQFVIPQRWVVDLWRCVINVAASVAGD